MHRANALDLLRISLSERAYRSSRLWVGLLFIAAFSAPSAIALADEDPAKANRLFTEAREKLKDDPEEALELLNEAENNFAHPAILLLKAKTQRELGMLEGAEATLGRVDTSKLPRPLRKVHDEEVAANKQARQELGRLSISVTPPTAVIVIDRQQFRRGYDRWRQPGEVKLEFVAPEFQPAVRSVNITKGDTVELEVTLVPLRGTIRVTVAGGLRGVVVVIDGKPAAIADGADAGDVASFEVSLGKHEVQCRRDGREVGNIVDVVFGTSVDVVCRGIEPAVDVTRLGLGWGGVATGVALAGYGVWGIQSYFSDLDFAKANGKIANTNKHYGGAVYLASGVAVGLASWWLLLRDDGAAPSRDTAGADGSRAATARPDAQVLSLR